MFWEEDRTLSVNEISLALKSLSRPRSKCACSSTKTAFPPDFTTSTARDILFSFETRGFQVWNRLSVWRGIIVWPFDPVVGVFTERWCRQKWRRRLLWEALELREISDWTGRSVQEARSRQEGSKSNPPPAGLLSGVGEGERPQLTSWSAQ
jgi:hypothetical protein